MFRISKNNSDHFLGLANCTVVNLKVRHDGVKLATVTSCMPHKILRNAIRQVHWEPLQLQTFTLSTVQYKQKQEASPQKFEPKSHHVGATYL